MDLGELEDFVQREEIMTITKAFEAWEQETENKARQTRNVEIALNMLKDSLPPEQISRLTGLTIAQIEDIQIKAK
jgi:predicted transposase/invertase (TIGR01784 family)